MPTRSLKDEAQMSEGEAEVLSPLDARQHVGPHRPMTVGAEETLPFQDQAAHLHRPFQSRGMASDLHVGPALNPWDIVLDMSDPARSLGQALADLVNTPR
ncbi:MAG: hypothetical protein JNN02_12105 [Tabrizicola sp.]|nr:hypothetical protein [Tabrizicola sp.]